MSRKRAGATALVLLGLVVIAVALLLVPYSHGTSRQHSSALHYWAAGCPQDEGEAWSERPFDEGQRARRECSTGAIARTTGAAAAIGLVGAFVAMLQVADIRRHNRR